MDGPRRLATLTAALLLVAAAPASLRAAAEESADKNGAHSTFSSEPKPLQLEGFPQRPRPILEIGERFLGTGTLNRGIKLPTGAVWQPSFILFGTLRSAVQSFDPGFPNGDAESRTAEWANRLDLFGNLYLSFTERILVGFRPLDMDGRFTQYAFQPDPGPMADRFRDELNFNVQTLFFEGDIGEIFPNLDKDDNRSLDYGIAVGRQLVAFQEGILINDNIDALGITKANLKPPGMVNFRWTLLWAWNELNRLGSAPDESASLWGLFTEADWRARTMEFDLIFVDADETAGGSSVHAGISAIQRLSGRYNTAFRVLTSFPTGDEVAPINQSGTLIFAEISVTPNGGHNLVYLNGFYGIDHFRSAARDPSAGGPLGRTGILFAAVGLGRFGAPLGNMADDSAGGSIGYQMFFAQTRQQLIVEAGGRYSNEEMIGQRAAAVGARYQIAVGRRGVIVFDAFAGTNNLPVAAPANGGAGAELQRESEVMTGGRLELVIKL